MPASVDTDSDSESDTECMMPRISSIVTVTIDPVATIESLEDEEATKVARELKPQTYVAFVNDAVSIMDADARYQTYNLRFISHGMISSKNDCMEADMCAPIYPAEHPLKREALRPSSELPWPNMYVSSLLESVVRVRNRREDASAAVGFDTLAIVRNDRLARGDADRRETLLAEAAKQRVPVPPQGDENKPPEPEHVPVQQEPTTEAKPETQDDDAASHRSARTASEDQACYEDAVPDDDNDLFQYIIDATRPPDDMVVVEVSYDLAAVAQVPDPREFFKEVQALDQLMKTTREQRIERARQLDEEAYGKSTKPPKKTWLRTIVAKVRQFSLPNLCRPWSSKFQLPRLRPKKRKMEAAPPESEPPDSALPESAPGVS